MEETKDSSLIYNRVLYALFVFLMIYRVFIKEDYLDAASSLGIALIFDPFNQETPWNQKPIWQKAWLLVHLSLTAALFGCAVGMGDKI